MICKAFSKTLPTKTKPCKFPERKEKKTGMWGQEKQKVQVKTVVSLLNFKTISKFCCWFCVKHVLIIALSFSNKPTIICYRLSLIYFREKTWWNVWWSGKWWSPLHSWDARLLIWFIWGLQSNVTITEVSHTAITVPCWNVLYSG